jgi:prophage regulatory protein
VVKNRLSFAGIETGGSIGFLHLNNSTKEIMEPEPTVRLLRTPAVEKISGLTAREIYNRVKKGTFPRPLKLGRRSLAWLASDIETWIKALVKEAGK